jgi:hypothetical protein
MGWERRRQKRERREVRPGEKSWAGGEKVAGGLGGEEKKGKKRRGKEKEFYFLLEKEINS